MEKGKVKGGGWRRMGEKGEGCVVALWDGHPCD